MKINEIKEILKGTFASVEDRKYWEDRLAEEQRREQTGKENAIYFKKMAKYNR